MSEATWETTERDYDRADQMVKRTPEIQAEMESLHTSLEKMEKVVAVLTERLRKVTRGDDPVQNGGPEVDSISQCELGNEIRGASRQVHKIESKLTDLIARIEL